MDARPGTYALLLRARFGGRIQIGRCGSLAVRPGWYIYIGSAFGPGGLRARLRHHCRLAERPHWHIDYLRRAAEPERVWYSHDPQHREHGWAESVGRLDSAQVPLSGFGASDCGCRSHLFFFSSPPRLDVFRRRIHAVVPGHARIASAALARTGSDSMDDASGEY